MNVMNPYHRTIANDVLDWVINAGNKILHVYEDMENFVRFFEVGKSKRRWDYFTFVDGDKVLIGWKDVPYGFMIHMDEHYVERIAA